MSLKPLQALKVQREPGRWRQPSLVVGMGALRLDGEFVVLGARPAEDDENGQHEQDGEDVDASYDARSCR